MNRPMPCKTGWVAPGRGALAALVVLLLAAQSCGPAQTAPGATQPVTRLDATLPVTVAASPTAASPTATVTASPAPTLAPSPLPSATPADPPDPALIRQGAAFSSLDPYQVDEIATGGYRPELPFCGESYLATLPEESGEIVLTLTFMTPLLPEQFEIYTGGQPEGIRRVEMLNSVSGLGRLIYESGTAIQREALAGGACAERLILPAGAAFEVDTLFIAFENLAAAGQVGAVEMLGRLEGLADVPVFWRVPLPGTPVDIAAGQDGRVYVATEPNGLYAYDVEGNQLQQYPAPSIASLSGVAADLFGNLVVTDAAYGWFIVISPEGEHLTIGGNETYYDAAVSPLDGNLYLLKAASISVFTTDTAELIREMPLDETRSYGSLAFDPQGRLYLLRDFNWSANLLVIDPITGEELDAVPLERSEQAEIVAHDLSIDASGNLYVLFSMNVGQIAVHMLDAQGNLVRRFGRLTGDMDDWPEGAFLDPRAITVSPDGRFILVADGYDDTAYLTAFLLEPQ
jgi:DNA-binding beta-propeller fold protein YncE